MLLFGDLDVTKVLGICALTLFLCSFIYNWIKTRNYPPGPIGFPLIGYVPFLGKSPNETLWKLSKKYGDIFSFYVGPRLVISVNDYKMIKEILCNPLTLARPPQGFDFIAGRAGFAGMNGEEWQEQRRFALITMRNLGMGKGLWETLIQECASDLVKEIQKKNGQPFSYDGILSSSQINNTLSLLLGRHLDTEKEKDTIEITRKFARMVMNHFSSVNIAVNNPSLGKVAEFLRLKYFQEFISTLRTFEAVFEREVNKRVETKEDHIKDDFISYYFQEMEKRNKDSKPHTFNLETLRGNLFMFVFAGLDSTLASVGWLFLLMAEYPTVQKKICDEIDRTIGRDGVVNYDDRVKLPYTTATAYEMMRFIAISPLFPPRYVLGDFEFGGYTIPKGSHIVCNSWGMLHDPRYHDDPMEFKPERFLTESGTKIKKTEGYGLFSFGKRNCPGEGFAMMSMYLYFVTVMQKFSIKTPHGGPPDMEYKYAAGVLPKPQNLCFIER